GPAPRTSLSRDRPLPGRGQADPPARGVSQPAVRLRQPGRARLLLDRGRGRDSARRLARGTAGRLHARGPAPRAARHAARASGLRL
ncbi:MAG: hypothetical protein AVDCRST_MAG17-39, partial [uncultured Solirubrobacterales bacterium]